MNCDCCGSSTQRSRILPRRVPCARAQPAGEVVFTPKSPPEPGPLPYLCGNRKKSMSQPRRCRPFPDRRGPIIGGLSILGQSSGVELASLTNPHRHDIHRRRSVWRCFSLSVRHSMLTLTKGRALGVRFWNILSLLGFSAWFQDGRIPLTVLRRFRPVLTPSDRLSFQR